MDPQRSEATSVTSMKESGTTDVTVLVFTDHQHSRDFALLMIIGILLSEVLAAPLCYTCGQAVSHSLLVATTRLPKSAAS